MKPLLLLLTAGLLCNLWPFSSRSVQRNAPAYVPQTTMEKLEAHVWTTFPGQISEYTSYREGASFFLFKNNIRYSRHYNYDGTWEPVVSEPFYFYTPGMEDKTDTIVDFETYQVFYYDRIGQALNGEHIVFDCAYAATGGKHRVYNNPISPIWDSIIISPPATGFTLSAKSFDIIMLNDRFLITRRNTDYIEGSEAIPSKSYNCFRPAYTPFPWDENIKKYYRKMPIIERPPYLGLEIPVIHL